MSKTPWEDRVKMLLTKPEIVWYYKAPDGKMYGGQPRLDFVACDIFGRFIMIEVKSVTHTAKTFSPRVIVPAVQQDALDRIAETASGVAILAVGHEDVLRLYNWGAIRTQEHIPLDGSRIDGTFWAGVWNGPAKWAQYNLHAILVKNWKQEPGPYSGLGPLAYVSTASIWTPSYSAPPVYESSPPILPPGIETRRIASTRTDLEIWAKAAQESGSPLVQEMKAKIYKRLESMAPAGVAERVAAEHVASQGSARPVLESIQNSVVKRAKPVPPTPPPEKTSGEKRKEILKKANRQHRGTRQ